MVPLLLVVVVVVVLVPHEPLGRGSSFLSWSKHEVSAKLVAAANSSRRREVESLGMGREKNRVEWMGKRPRSWAEAYPAQKIPDFSNSH